MDQSVEHSMIEDCENRESHLTDYERSFVDSVGKQLRDGRKLSARQSEILNDVWERVSVYPCIR